MTKNFCDICGAPAPERANDIEIARSYGDKYLSADCGSHSDSVKQPVIRVGAIFNFRLRQDGFGGPPDLCPTCRHQLLQELADKAKPHA